MKKCFILSGIFVLAGILSANNARADIPALHWDANMKSTNLPEGTPSAHFAFYFTNVAMQVEHTEATNITDPATGVAFGADAVMPSPVTVLNVRPSCGCTTAQLPSMPWVLPPGTNGQIGVTVNLAGKSGTVVKTVHVGTDHGSCDLMVQITIVRQTVKPSTDADRIRQMEIARADRQAVFRNDCASCHEKPGESKYGKDLFDADCAICHEAQHRATMVPDLHALTVPTNVDFWRNWIAHGKPGTFMPAFSTADGGPLNDMQITSLAYYLNFAIPSKIAQMR
jgi:mono/diheme cytochrome c family protein